MRHNRAWFCNRITYRNRKAAERALQQAIAAGVGVRHAYRCEYCGKFHLTSGTPRR